MPDSERNGQNKNKKIWLIAAGIYAVVALCVYMIVNSTAISAWFGKVMAALSPLLLGLAIAYLCNPILKLFDLHVFKKVRSDVLRRLFSILLTYAIVLAIIFGFLWILIPELMKSLSELTKQYSEYAKTASENIAGFIEKYFPGIASDNFKEEEIRKKITEFLLGTENLLNHIIGFVQNYGGSLLSGVKNVFIGLVISVYFLFSKEKRCAQCKKFVTAVFGDKQQRFLYRTARRIDSSFGGFFEGKILDSAIIGILTYVVLLIFRIPFPVLVAFIVGVTNIIPVFGPFIGAFASAFIIFIEDPKKVIPFLIIVLIIQQLDGNVIGPKILGDNIGVSSFCVMISIVIMGNLFGVVGMIIGVPLFAVIIEFVGEFLDKRLRRKHKPIDTEKYMVPGPVAEVDTAEYPPEVDPDDLHPHYVEEHQTFSKRVARYVKTKFKKGKNSDAETAEHGENKGGAKGSSTGSTTAETPDADKHPDKPDDQNK